MSNQSTPVSGAGHVQAGSNPSVGSTNVLENLIRSAGSNLGTQLGTAISLVQACYETLAGFRMGQGKRLYPYARLANAKLVTTDTKQRIAALTAETINLRKQLNDAVPETVKLFFELSLAETELAAQLKLQGERERASQHVEATGLYPHTRAAIDYLYREYGVDQWHWANADADLLKQVGELLRRQENLVSRTEQRAQDAERSRRGLV